MDLVKSVRVPVRGRMPMEWTRSSRCISSGCVEVQVLGDAVLVRNSAAADGPVLTYSHDEWVAFIDGVRAGEFGLDDV